MNSTVFIGAPVLGLPADFPVPPSVRPARGGFLPTIYYPPFYPRSGRNGGKSLIFVKSLEGTPKRRYTRKTPRFHAVFRLSTGFLWIIESTFESSVGELRSALIRMFPWPATEVHGPTESTKYK
jgi:hypothetical protein